MSDAKAKLDNALTSALAQYEDTMGEAFEVTPTLDVLEESTFGALAEIIDSELFIRVSTGTVAMIKDLWTKVLADEDFKNSAFGMIDGSAEYLTHAGLTWLMLHEMHHQQMGHFELLDRAQLTESSGAKTFSVVKRASSPNPILAGLDKNDVPKVEPSLEMQADHDALEMVLDAYSANGWTELRARTAAISAMMMLIEREDAKHVHEHSSHPKAATRIFQLLGHLIQMPSIQAMIAKKHPELGIEPIIPPEEENKGYTSKVVVPAFFDAVNLARIANAEGIREDLGEPEDFFKDVEASFMVDPAQFGGLLTQGANQWAELVLINGKLLEMLGLD